MQFYARKRSQHPAVSNRQLAPEFKDLKLNPLMGNKIKDIIAFLEALNDPDFDRSIPDTVPSGLTVEAM